MFASWTELLSSTIIAEIQRFLILTNSGDRALAMLAASAAPLMAIRVEVGVRILGRFHEIQTLLDRAIARVVTIPTPTPTKGLPRAPMRTRFLERQASSDGTRP